MSAEVLLSSVEVLLSSVEVLLSSVEVSANLRKYVVGRRHAVDSLDEFRLVVV